MKTCSRCRIGDCHCIRELPGRPARSAKVPLPIPGPVTAEVRQGNTKDATAETKPPLGNDLIKAMAEAVGKSLAAYVEVMYPEAMKAASSTFKLSLRNHVYNDIMHVSTLHTEAEIRKWLDSSEAHRKEWLGMYRKMRRKAP